MDRLGSRRDASGISTGPPEVLCENSSLKGLKKASSGNPAVYGKYQNLAEKLPSQKAVKLMGPASLTHASSFFGIDAEKAPLLMSKPRNEYVDRVWNRCIRELLNSGDGAKGLKVLSAKTKLIEGVKLAYESGDWKKVAKGGKSLEGMGYSALASGVTFYNAYNKCLRNFTKLSSIQEANKKIVNDIARVSVELEQMKIAYEFLQEKLVSRDNDPDVLDELGKAEELLLESQEELDSLLKKLNFSDELLQDSRCQMALSGMGFVASSFKAASSALKIAIYCEPMILEYREGLVKEAAKGAVGVAAAIGIPLGAYGVYSDFKNALQKEQLIDRAERLELYYKEDEPDAELAIFAKTIRLNQDVWAQQVSGYINLAKTARSLMGVGMISGAFTSAGEMLGVAPVSLASALAPVTVLVSLGATTASLGLRYYQHYKVQTRQDSEAMWLSILSQAVSVPIVHSIEYQEALESLAQKDEYKHLNPKELREVLKSKAVRKLMQLNVDFAVNVIIQRLRRGDDSEASSAARMLLSLGLEEKDVLSLLKLGESGACALLKRRLNLI